MFDAVNEIYFYPTRSTHGLKRPQYGLVYQPSTIKLVGQKGLIILVILVTLPSSIWLYATQHDTSWSYW